MTPEKRNSIEELFWRIALHYQLLRILEPEGVTDGYAPNEGVDAGRPVREFPEEAYCFEFEDPGYTLEELLAQLPKSNTPEQIEVAEERTTQPVREFPEEAYLFDTEELEQPTQPAGAEEPIPPNRTRTEEPRIRVRKPDYTLKDLLAQITEENRHEEIDFGPPVGKEVW